MKTKHRTMLRDLLNCLSKLGGSLDPTATNPAKYIDRQKAHQLVYDVIYAVLADHPENDTKEDDFERAEKSLKELKELTTKNYPDRQGFILK